MPTDMPQIQQSPQLRQSRQVVDPFVPTSRPAKQVAGVLARSSRPVQVSSQPVAPVAKVAVPGRSRNIDGVVPAPAAVANASRPYRGPAASLHLQYAQKPQSSTAALVSKTSAPSAQPTVAAEQQAKRAKKTKDKKEGISTIWLVAGAAVAGVALFSVIAGQIALAAYAVAAIWRRLPSQQSFVLALVMFGGIIIASLIPAFRNVADNLAVYAFLLLCIGAISLAREVRRDMHPAASK